MKKLLTLAFALTSVLLAGCASSTPTDDAVAPVAEEVVSTGVVETPVVEQAPVVEETTTTTGTTVTTTGTEVATGN